MWHASGFQNFFKGHASPLLIRWQSLCCRVANRDCLSYMWMWWGCMYDLFLKVRSSFVSGAVLPSDVESICSSRYNGWMRLQKREEEWRKEGEKEGGRRSLFYAFHTSNIDWGPNGSRVGRDRWGREGESRTLSCFAGANLLKAVFPATCRHKSFQEIPHSSSHESIH